jgi:hypothetical protein
VRKRTTWSRRSPARNASRSESVIPDDGGRAVKNGRFGRDGDGVLASVPVVEAVDRTRFTRLTYLLFGLALLSSNALSLRSSIDLLPVVAVVMSLLVVVAAAAGLVRPDAAPLGVSVDIGAQPTWVLALLWFGSALLLAGVVIQL